ncbi:prolyl 4-hydroxylase [Sphingomonas sp. BE138]|uniref:prolyl hydroxylase family protein n=1 Tax=Sphingomonas sp. BE138 TaxID=2817845 RepID=UPI00286268CF|nr:2OG-Fe(II) oxygenase [Sphingomonas sp. BE138]MDR6786801.1 prolyl 4-hydroxylase [Sphingomonas sp. BE138]
MSIAHLPPGQPSSVRAQQGAAVAARLDADPRMQRLPSDAITAWRCPDFLDAANCDWLVQVIDANRRPSTLFSDRGGPGSRTSDSCDMDRNADGIRQIDQYIAASLGLAPELGETMQGQRYAPGQLFRAHHDYFHEAESYWPAMRENGGQRTFTAMIYLNDVEEGGATWFPKGGVRVAPRKGMLLAWNNMAADGSPNTATLHEGMAVLEGTKYIITKWFREEPWGRRPRAAAVSA